MNRSRKLGLGRLLGGSGVLLMLSQTFQETPIPVLFLGGLAVATLGGVLIADNRQARR